MTDRWLGDMTTRSCRHRDPSRGRGSTVTNGPRLNEENRENA
jgi:hypothetical protein